MENESICQGRNDTVVEFGKLDYVRRRSSTFSGFTFRHARRRIRRARKRKLSGDYYQFTDQNRIILSASSTVVKNPQRNIADSDSNLRDGIQNKTNVAGILSSPADNDDSDCVILQCNTSNHGFKTTLSNTQVHNDDDKDYVDGAQSAAPGTIAACKNKQGINTLDICQKHNPVNPMLDSESCDQRDNSGNNTQCQEGVLTLPLMKSTTTAQTYDPPPVPTRTYKKIVTPVTLRSTSLLPPRVPNRHQTRGFHNTGLKEGQDIVVITPSGADLNGCLIPYADNRRYSMPSCRDLLNQVNTNLIEEDYSSGTGEEGFWSRVWADPQFKPQTRSSCARKNELGGGTTANEHARSDSFKIVEGDGAREEKSPPVPKRTYKQRPGDSNHTSTSATPSRLRSASVGNSSVLSKSQKSKALNRKEVLSPATDIERNYHKHELGFGGESSCCIPNSAPAFLAAVLNNSCKYPSDSHIYQPEANVFTERTPNVTCDKNTLVPTGLITTTPAVTPRVPTILIETVRCDDGPNVDYTVDQNHLVDDIIHPPPDKTGTKKEIKAPQIPERTYKKIIDIPDFRARSSTFSSFGMHHRKSTKVQDLRVHFSLNTRDLDGKSIEETDDNVNHPRRHSFTAPSRSQGRGKKTQSEKMSPSPTGESIIEDVSSPRPRSSSFSDYVRRLISPGPDTVRMKERLQATMAGVEELHILRETQRLAVEEAKMIGKSGRQRSNTFDPSELQAKRRQEIQRKPPADGSTTNRAQGKRRMFLHPHDALQGATTTMDWDDEVDTNTMRRDRSSTWSGVPQPPTPPRVRRHSGRRRYDSGGRHKHKRDSNANINTASEIKVPSAPLNNATEDSILPTNNHQAVESAHSKLDELIQHFPEPFMRPRTFSGGDFKFPSPMHAVLLQCEDSNDASNPAMHFQYGRSNSIGRRTDVPKKTTPILTEDKELVAESTHALCPINSPLNAPKDRSFPNMKPKVSVSISKCTESDSCTLQPKEDNPILSIASPDKIVKNVSSIAISRQILVQARDTPGNGTFSDRDNAGTLREEIYKGKKTSEGDKIHVHHANVSSKDSRLNSLKESVSLEQSNRQIESISGKGYGHTPVGKVTAEKAIAELNRNMQDLGIVETEPECSKRQKTPTPITPSVASFHKETRSESNTSSLDPPEGTLQFVAKRRLQKSNTPTICTENDRRSVQLNSNVNNMEAGSPRHPKTAPSHLDSFAEEEEICEVANLTDREQMVGSSPIRSKEAMISLSLEDGYFSEPGTPRHSLASNISEISHYTTSSSLSSIQSDG